MGIHSSDLVKFRVTADFMSSSTLNFTKSPTSNTANLEILVLDSRLFCPVLKARPRADFAFVRKH
ncbi:hypothetical protein [Helicobacter cinaedi]|uniref:hypothetical protein n=1 Tax=Helicobacter cinaedi TaxID=213 RepID=UPI001F3FF080|nr:hypothetical protein [Helicobacter cinaedi]